jgi:hypothetical protein
VAYQPCYSAVYFRRLYARCSTGARNFGGLSQRNHEGVGSRDTYGISDHSSENCTVPLAIYTQLLMHSLTWALRIVRVELARQKRGGGHLEEEYGGVEERLYKKRARQNRMQQAKDSGMLTIVP